MNFYNNCKCLQHLLVPTFLILILLVCNKNQDFPIISKSPIASYPVGEIESAPTNFIWTPVENAEQYRIEIFNIELNQKAVFYTSEISDEENQYEYLSFTIEATDEQQHLIEPSQKGITWNIVALNYAFEVNSDPLLYRLGFPPKPISPNYDESICVSNDQDVTIEWENIDYVQGYHIQIAAEEDFAHIIYDEKIQANKLVWQPHPSYNEYWWRVSTIYEQNIEGKYSDKQVFKTKPIDPFLYAPGTCTDGNMSPGNQLACIIFSSLDNIQELNFNNDPNLSENIQYTTYNDFPTACLDVSSVQPGEYFWYYKVDADGCSRYFVHPTIVNDEGPAPPEGLISPQNGCKTDEFTFKWRSNSGETYFIEYWKTNQPNQKISACDANGCNRDSITINFDQDDDSIYGEYQWSIYARNSCGDGEPSLGESWVVESCYSIGGIVSGLPGKSTVQLINNDDERITINDNGEFTFHKLMQTGENYTVTVDTSAQASDELGNRSRGGSYGGITPIQQLNCNVINGSGKVQNKDVTNIKVECKSGTYTIPGSG